MVVREIKSGIYHVGAIDWDRRLFDELIPLPDGTSYNSYLVRGSEKTALIETVDPTKIEELAENLREIGVARIDYVIANHAEQDHSGGIQRILDGYPMAKVVTNPRCKEFLMSLLLVPDNRFLTVEDGQTMSLGDRTFEFIYAPWVHWPETMLTYLREDRMLFPCDLFGSHLATSDLYAVDEAKVYQAAKRYYAEIMMPFRQMIQRHLEKLSKYQINIIAPSHGPIYDRPEFIVNAYKDWTSDKVKNEVVIAYVSMHGSTRKMVDYVVGQLTKLGIGVKPYNLTKTDIGELASDLVDTATIIVATPTVLASAHPAAVYATHLANALRPKVRFASLIGSYGWGGKVLEQLTGMLNAVKVELLTPVIVKGYPKEEDFRALDRLVSDIANKHKEIGIF